ncbi:hypothetical protein VTK73DRAFT_3629 [Phialemonium thermophilum]|uniref:N-acetyltransferase domain-containing protein n=1 Tax=Phialemonium thermophilum TaxID=223376 RepID=A0ABR3WYH2_9PEZI
MSDTTAAQEQATSESPAHYTINTPRLVVRSTVLSDAPAICALMINQANFPFDEVNPNLTTETYRERIARWAGATARLESAFMVVTLRDSGEIIGFGGFNLFRPGPNGSGREGDTGIVIDHRYWRKGYAKEAVCGTVEFGFGALGCDRMAMDTSAENEPWRAFMRNLGLGHTESKREDGRDGKWDWVYRFPRATWEVAKQELKDKGQWPL